MANCLLKTGMPLLGLPHAPLSPVKPLRVWLAGRRQTVAGRPSNLSWRAYQLRQIDRAVETLLAPLPTHEETLNFDEIRRWQPDIIHAFGGRAEAKAAQKCAQKLGCAWIFQPDAASLANGWQEEPAWTAAEVLVTEDRRGRQRLNARTGRMAAIVPPSWPLARRPEVPRKQAKDRLVWIGEDHSADGRPLRQALAQLRQLELKHPLEWHLVLGKAARRVISSLKGALPENLTLSVHPNDRALRDHPAWDGAELYVDLGHPTPTAGEAIQPSRLARACLNRQMPILAGPEGCMWSLIAHQQTGLRFEHDQGVLAEATFNFALEHREECHFMGRNLYEYAYWHFHPQDNAQQLFNLYQDVVGAC